MKVIDPEFSHESPGKFTDEVLIKRYEKSNPKLRPLVKQAKIGLNIPARGSLSNDDKANIINWLDVYNPDEELKVIDQPEVVPKHQNNIEPSTDNFPSVISETELILYDNAIEDFYSGVGKARKALLIVRDQKLYRAEYKAFEEFCEKKLHVGRSQAYRMIEFEKVTQNLSPIGDKTQLPSKESHSRILSKYSSED
ncbi:MAG: hypothetical protein KZQ83_13355 [gamma proteobacterium symbiont of Taylorina sp.]|nr:hypothetical protein [gamma proteobacterium symbiont of Taylorina sp.]